MSAPPARGLFEVGRLRAIPGPWQIGGRRATPKLSWPVEATTSLIPFSPMPLCLRNILTPRMQRMLHAPYLPDRQMVSEASHLLIEFGDDAGFEAANRAERSREVGNVSHFCRWRQIERLIILLSSDRVNGTVH